MGIFDYKIWKAIKARSPVLITPFNPESLGLQLSACAVAAPASTTLGSANQGLFYPFNLDAPFTIRKFFCFNGATVAGNVDMGVLNEEYTLLVSTGTTAQADASDIQEIDVTDYQLQAGRYYLGISHTDAAATFFTSDINIASNNNFGWAFGCFGRSALFPLATTTPEALSAVTKVPVFGITSRTFVK